MIEILNNWIDYAKSQARFYCEAYEENPEFKNQYHYWSCWEEFLLDAARDLEKLKAHNSPQKKRAIMLNGMQTRNHFYRENFKTHPNLLRVMAGISVSSKLKTLFTAWDPTGDPIRKYKILK